MRYKFVCAALLLLAMTGCDNESDSPAPRPTHSVPRTTATATATVEPGSDDTTEADSPATSQPEQTAAAWTVLVFVGLKASGDPNAYIPGTSNAYVTLYADGTVLRGLPVEGPSGYEVGSGGVPDTGRFTDDGTSLHITWSAGETVDVEVDQSNHLMMYGTEYGPVNDLNDAVLSGTYSRASGGGGGRISFESGQRFTDTGITGDTGLLTTDNPTGSGTYRVKENTLILSYDSGAKQSFSIYALPQNLADLSPVVLAGFVFETE